jgi:hypothetical protein
MLTKECTTLARLWGLMRATTEKCHPGPSRRRGKRSLLHNRYDPGRSLSLKASAMSGTPKGISGGGATRVPQSLVRAVVHVQWPAGRDPAVAPLTQRRPLPRKRDRQRLCATANWGVQQCGDLAQQVQQPRIFRGFAENWHFCPVRFGEGLFRPVGHELVTSEREKSFLVSESCIVFLRA